VHDYVFFFPTDIGTVILWLNDAAQPPLFFAGGRKKLLNTKIKKIVDEAQQGGLDQKNTSTHNFFALVFPHSIHPTPRDIQL
jgi:hypothetical protein